MELATIEREIWDAIEARKLPVHPKVFLVASLALPNRVSAKFYVGLLPFVYVKQHETQYRSGARWLLFATNVNTWPLTSRHELFNIVMDEITEYIEKGTINREISNVATNLGASVQRGTRQQYGTG